MRHNPEKREQLTSAFEHCDMVTVTLCGITSPSEAFVSWATSGSGTRSGEEEFLIAVDPLLTSVREKLQGEVLTSDHLAGHLSEAWAQQLGLCAGIPIPVGAFDAHWDSIGVGCREGDVVNVVGTSTCIIAMQPQTTLIPGVCGVVSGSVHPKYTGYESFGDRSAVQQSLTEVLHDLREIAAKNRGAH